MRAPFPTRRRADEFQSLLDGTLAEPRSTDLAPLVEIVGRVQSVASVAPRAEFAAHLRERLMAEAPTALASTPADDATTRLTVGRRSPDKAPRPAPSRTSRERRIGVAIAAFSLVGATTASAVAAQGALPGDTLYPVKRLIEDTRTSLAMGQDAKAEVLLSQARTRLTEARELGTRDDADPADIEQALEDFGSTAHQASTVILADYADHGRRQPVDQLRAFTEQGVTTLSELTSLLPPTVDDAIADAANTLLDIDNSAAAACPACDGAGITELPSDLIALLSASTGGPSEAAATAARPQVATKTGKHRHTPSADPSTAPGGSPLGQLTNPLTNPLTNADGGKTGTKQTPGSDPTSAGGAVTGVGGAVGGTVSGVGGAVGDLGNQVGDPVGGLLDGAGDAVGDLGNAVGDTTDQLGGTLDGVVGGVLGSTPTTTPTP